MDNQDNSEITQKTTDLGQYPFVIRPWQLPPVIGVEFCYPSEKFLGWISSFSKSVHSITPSIVPGDDIFTSGNLPDDY